jgi:uncharacterized protein YkwD
MGSKWLGAVLAMSLILNGVFLVLFIRQRAEEPGGGVVAAVAQQEASPPPASPPATSTPRPQPAITQATRPPVSPATESPDATSTESAPEPSPTVASTEEPPPSPSPTPDPTATPTTPPTPTIEAVGTDWLRYLNLFRQQANLPPLLENTLWSLDSAQHSRYMTYTGNLGHSEDGASQYYTRGGQTAGENGNIAAGFIGSDPFKWAFNYWMSAPFHAIPILDPQLATTGFAEYRDASAAQPLTATLDVRRGLGPLLDGVSYPIMFPRDDGLTWVLRYSLPEFPEALSTCPGYQQPTGAPIILQIGDGSQVPSVTASSLFRDDQPLAHCRFDETNFTHPNEFRQRSARLILDNRDAIVIIPQQPLVPDSTYSVRIDANGQTYTWSFRTASGPP